MCAHRMEQRNNDIQHDQSDDGDQRSEVRHPRLLFDQVLIEGWHQWHPNHHDASQITIHFWTNWGRFLYTSSCLEIHRFQTNYAINIPVSQLKQSYAPYQLWCASQRTPINNCAAISARTFDKMFQVLNFRIPSGKNCNAWVRPDVAWMRLNYPEIAPFPSTVITNFPKFRTVSFIFSHFVGKMSVQLLRLSTHHNIHCYSFSTFQSVRKHRLSQRSLSMKFYEWMRY